MNLVPTFTPPRISLASEKVSEFERLSSLLQVALLPRTNRDFEPSGAANRPTAGDQPTIGGASAKRTSSLIRASSSGTRQTFLDRCPWEQEPLPATATATATAASNRIDLFGGSLAWEKPAKKRDERPDSDAVVAPSEPIVLSPSLYTTAPAAPMKPPLAPIFLAATSATKTTTNANAVTNTTTTISTIIAAKPTGSPVKAKAAAHGAKAKSFQLMLRHVDEHISSLPPEKKRKTDAAAAPSKLHAFPPLASQATSAEVSRAAWSARNDRSANSSKNGAQLAFVAEDFSGIDRVCRNAGGTAAGLELFVKQATSSQSMIGISIVLRDLTSNHAPTSIRYCTPSAACSVWHCTCEKAIRADSLKHAVLGVICVLSVTKAEVTSQVAYFLPLVTCVEPPSAEPGTLLAATSTAVGSAEDQNAFPLKCGTTVHQRWKALTQVLSSSNVTKVLFNAQMAFIPLHTGLQAQSFLSFPPELLDPRLAMYLLDPDKADSQLELVELVGPIQVGDVSGLGRVSRSFVRSVGEIKALLAIAPAMQQQMQELGLWPLYRTVEMPLAFILSSMEADGILVDKQALDTQASILTEHCAELEASILNLAGVKFNVSSPEQVSRVLFEVLKIPSSVTSLSSEGSSEGTGNGETGEKSNNNNNSNKKKFQSTSEEELMKISSLHPVVDLILQHRAASKLLTTYIDGLRPWLQSSRDASSSVATIHANWNQTSVRTGRLSCSKPNLQNIPNQQTIGEQPYNMRAMFVARDGWTFVGSDYSQIEVRVLAHLCQDAALGDLFRRKEDIYSQLAARVFGKPIAEVQDEERNRAKVVCLGVLYGMGAAATAAKLGLDVSAAQRIIQSFFNNFSNVKQWIQNTKVQARKFKHVRTLLGRMRHLPNIVSTDQSLAATAERQAVNSIIQGTASDLIKLAMILSFERISQWRRENPNRPSPRLVMQIHDELIFEVSKEESCLQAFTSFLSEVMEKEIVRVLKLQVPLMANICVGDQWGSMVPWPSAQTAADLPALE